MSACQRGFFAEVGAYVGHPELTVLPAEPGPRLFTLLQSVHSAFPGAKKALLKQLSKIIREIHVHHTGYMGALLGSSLIAERLCQSVIPAEAGIQISYGVLDPCQIPSPKR